MAQQDYFLKLDGINGESQDDKHSSEIQLLSFSLGGTNQGAGGYGQGSGAARSQVHDVSFTKRADTSTPALLKACFTGKSIGDAVVTARKAGGDAPVEYLVIKLTEVFVTSYHTAAMDGNDVAIESGSLNFSKIEYNYTPQNADGTAGGTITTGYDVKKNLGS